MARIRATVVLVGYGMGAGVALEAARRLPLETIGVVAIDALYDAESTLLSRPHREAVAAYEEDFAKACREAMTALADFSGEPQESFAARCATSPQIAIPLLRQMAIYSAAAALSFVAAPVRGINAVRPATRADIDRRYAPTYDVALLDSESRFPRRELPIDCGRRLAEWVVDLENRLIVVDR